MSWKVRGFVALKEGADLRRESVSVRCEVSRSSSNDLFAPDFRLISRWKTGSAFRLTCRWTRLFIAERLRTTLEAIEDLLIKERLDLPPRLRELDGDVETIELELRARIVRALDGDPALLPHHVRDRIEERIRAALKKSPALHGDRYVTLAGKLEYADLRELEDIVKNKALRYRFDGLFPNREALVKHFDQLADLRNGIRHSRTVDEVTRKQGEASILWFRKVLPV